MLKVIDSLYGVNSVGIMYGYEIWGFGEKCLNSWKGAIMIRIKKISISTRDVFTVDRCILLIGKLYKNRDFPTFLKSGPGAC